MKKQVNACMMLTLKPFDHLHNKINNCEVIMDQYVKRMARGGDGTKRLNIFTDSLHASVQIAETRIFVQSDNDAGYYAEVSLVEKNAIAMMGKAPVRLNPGVKKVLIMFYDENVIK